MHILERYYLVDDNGNEHELKCKVQTDIAMLREETNHTANKELLKIRNNELLAELSLMGVQ
jgi:hypothetical protein